jgi:hypothetical protein
VIGDLIASNRPIASGRLGSMPANGRSVVLPPGCKYANCPDKTAIAACRSQSQIESGIEVAKWQLLPVHFPSN